MRDSYQPDSRFSIHTFLLRRRITGMMWKDIMDLIYDNQKICNDPRLIENDFYKGNRILTYKAFKDQGIIIYLKWIEEGIRITHLHSIELKVSPRRLIGDNTYVGVFDFSYSNMKDLDKSLSEILLDLGFAGSNGLESFELSRVDLCMNLYIENIDIFINSVRKCRTPKGFKKLRYKNKKNTY